MEDTDDPGRKKYLYDGIVGRIQQMIHAGELKTGDRLPAERSLARELGVSRNCIRQAIQALSEKNILESRRGDGTYVRTPDGSVIVRSFALAIQAHKDMLKDIIQYRLLMEPQIAFLAAANVTREDLDRLKIIVCDQERRILAGEEDSDLDDAFHHRLAVATGNRVIHVVADTIRQILNESRSEYLRSPARRKASIVGHLMIIDALEERNAQKAFQAMRDHLLAVEQAIFGAAAASEQPQ